MIDDQQIVLSHGVPNPKNIILLDEQDGSVSISGIVDWEMGGWYLEYWDAMKALNVRSTDNEIGAAPFRSSSIEMYQR